MAGQSILNTEEKLEAVLTPLRKEDTVAKIARRFSVSENSLYRHRVGLPNASKFERV